MLESFIAAAGTPVFWVIAAVCFAIIEVFWTGLWYSLIVGVGALLTALLAVFIHNPLVLSLVFIALSILGATFTVPVLARKIRINQNVRPSNDEALIGTIAIVTKPITPETKGEVRVSQEMWTAASSDSLTEGEKVVVTGIIGVTLQVKRGEEA